MIGSSSTVTLVDSFTVASKYFTKAVFPVAGAPNVQHETSI